MRLGIDLGGTKIEILALDPQGRTLETQRIATPRGRYEDILAAIKQLVLSVEGNQKAKGSVGIGIPGVVDPFTQLVKNANTTELNGKPFLSDLEALLARPVRIANDANCFTLSEAVDGAAKGEGVVFGIILGTGCGGGIVVNRQLLPGRNAIGGEWGHNRLPDMRADEYPGEPCYCGHAGCIETFVSGTGFARDFQKMSGIEASAREIAALMESGDPIAIEAFERLEDRLARALASIINVLDPDCIVAGGGLSNVRRIYENVPKIWGSYVFTTGEIRTRFVAAQHGDSSGVRGAACLWDVRS